MLAQTCPNFSKANSTSNFKNNIKCMEYGNLWDLAVVSTPEEMQRIVDLTKCSHHAFWVGVKKPWIGSGFRNIFNEPAKYLPVSKHSISKISYELAF